MELAQDLHYQVLFRSVPFWGFLKFALFLMFTWWSDRSVCSYFTKLISANLVVYERVAHSYLAGFISVKHLKLIAIHVKTWILSSLWLLPCLSWFCFFHITLKDLISSWFSQLLRIAWAWLALLLFIKVLSGLLRTWISFLDHLTLSLWIFQIQASAFP